MQVDVSRAVKDPGQSYPFEATAQIEDMVFLDDPVTFTDVRMAGSMVGVGAGVRVDAHVSAGVSSRCALCLTPVHTRIEADIDALFAKEPDPEDPDQFPLDGYHIETDGLAREALVPALPMRFLCSDTCKGLCPVCGVNCNTTPCTCQEGGERQSPFSALSHLLTEDEEV